MATDNKKCVVAVNRSGDIGEKEQKEFLTEIVALARYYDNLKIKKIGLGVLMCALTISFFGLMIFKERLWGVILIVVLFSLFLYTSQDM